RLLVGGDESIDKASIDHSALLGRKFKRSGPDIAIDKHDAIECPTFFLRAYTLVFESLIDVVVIEDVEVVRDAALGVGLQAHGIADHKGAVGLKRAFRIVVGRFGMAELRFFGLSVDLPMSCPDRELIAPRAY